MSVAMLQYFPVLVYFSACLCQASAALHQHSSSTPKFLQLQVQESCNKTTLLSWDSDKWKSYTSLHSGPLLCDITYYQTGQSSAQIIDVYLESQSHRVHLFNLSVGVKYTAFMVCEETIRTSHVSFLSGSLCGEKAGHNSSSSDDQSNIEPPVVATFSNAPSYNAVELPIAIAFAFMAVVMIAVVAFFIWRKYQRRQRILRIFRQGQNDPFQALYSPTQDSYSI